MDDKQTVIRILHAGDIHLDSIFQSLSPARAEARREEFRSALRDMAAYICREKIDVLLLSGDLFDEEFVTAETVLTLQRIFEEMADTEVYISPGNHDPYTASSLYAAKPFPENVTVFKDEKIHKVLSTRYPVTVFGYAFTGTSLPISPLAGFCADSDGRLQLVVGHADLDVPLSVYAPVMTGDILSFGAHYTALSHRHNAESINRAGDVLYGYSGFFLGRSFDEIGKGGVHLITATCVDEKWQLTAERISFSKRSYEKETLDVTGAPDADAVLAAIKKRIDEKGYGEETLLRVTLTGALSPEFSMASVKNRLPECERGLFSLSLIDHTSPTYDTSLLEADMSIRGEVYRNFLPKLTEGTPEERAEASMALKLALAALGGQPPVI